MRNQQNVKVRVNSNFETICPFPVGYVYMSSNSTSPADIYGGTWSAISGGRYMRAAAAWGNGGSNTITINQMPSHNHIIPKHYVYDKTGWSAPINGLSLPQVAQPAPSTTPFATIEGLDAVTNTGGGQHSTPLTKTFGRGTELPKEGDASCVTFKQFKSRLATRLKRFVHSQLVTSICQATRQVQQTFMAARGQLSQIVDSCSQAVRGTLQAVQHNCMLKSSQVVTILGDIYIKIGQKITLDGITTKCLLLEQLKQEVKVILRGLQYEVQQITLMLCHLIVPVIAGIAPLRQIRGEW